LGNFGTISPDLIVPIEVEFHLSTRPGTHRTCIRDFFYCGLLFAIIFTVVYCFAKSRLFFNMQKAQNGEDPEGSVGVNCCNSAMPEAKPSGREGCELLSFELPEGEAGVGIQNVCKSSGTPECALAVTDTQQFGTPKVSLARELTVAGGLVFAGAFTFALTSVVICYTIAV
jgi:hypothetical protein